MRKSVTFLRPVLLPLVTGLNRLLRHLTSFTHKAQLYLEWAVKPNPEWFDHFIDQYHGWHHSRISFPWERGIFGLLSMKQGARVPELCCGDGFNAHHFYSIRATEVIAVDFDPKAIAHARKNFQAPNVRYQLQDIRKALPSGHFDNIVWDAAIEHYTLDEMNTIFNNIKQRLGNSGVLSGYTLVEDAQGPAHDNHEHEFGSKTELQALLLQHFTHVVVFDTLYPTRHNLYFYASAAPLSFLDDFQTKKMEIRVYKNSVTPA